MTNVNPVDAAIAKANAAAAATATATPDNKTVDLYKDPSSNGAVASYIPGKLKTLDDLNPSSLACDLWLKFGEHGISVKGKDGLVDEPFNVTIDMTKVQVFDCISTGGDNPIYFKTFDGASDIKGGNWVDSIKKAQAINPKAYIYQGADLAMTLIDDLKDSKGNLLAKAGTILGYSTTSTGKANLFSFIQQVKEKNLTKSVVEVTLGFQKKTKPGINPWAVPTLLLVGEFVGDGE